MKTSTAFILSACLVISSFFLISGCVHKDEAYTYESIKKAYDLGRSEPHVLEDADRSASPPPAGPLSIMEAIEISLKNNPDIEMAVARITRSAALIDEAMAAFWPHLSVYGETIQGNAPSAYLFKTIDQRELPSRINFNDPGWFENVELGLQGRMNLFNGGRDILRRKMAETGLHVQELDRQSVENALIASVIQTFYNNLAAGDYISIARESVTTVEKQLGVMRFRYEAGAALKSDVLSLEVRLAQAREDLVRSENNFSLTVAALANLLGLDPDTSLSLKEGEKVPGHLPADYRSGLVQALADRAELEKVRQEIIRSRMALDQVRSEYLPRLDALGKVYADDPGLDFDRERENWTIGLLLNWDFFTGNSTRTRENQAKAVLQEMMALDRKTILSVQLDLKTAYLRLEEARARTAVTEASVAQAEESLRLVKIQYEGGSANITRYLDAELARNMARIRATAAYHDREKAKADVGRALGFWGKMIRKTGDRPISLKN
ncbi:MAG: TolC family protein [Pseudomonadota bacterium]